MTIISIHWTGIQYEALATYKLEEPEATPLGGGVAGIDLGEIHLAVSHDGENTHILNGRLLRSKRQYRNKLIHQLNSKIDGKKKDSCRKKKLVRSKQRQLKKLNSQIKDIEHQQTTRLVSTYRCSSSGESVPARSGWALADAESHVNGIMSIRFYILCGSISPRYYIQLAGYAHTNAFLCID